MPRRGLEPPRPNGHWHLKPARLPIPPSGHINITTGIEPLSVTWAVTIADKSGVSNAFQAIDRQRPILLVLARGLRFFVSFGLPRNLIEKVVSYRWLVGEAISVLVATGRGTRIWAFWMARRSR